MIKVNNKWGLRKDDHCWELSMARMGRDKKTGKPKPSQVRTWHRDLRQVAAWMLKEDGKDCPSLSEINLLYETATDSVESYLKEVAK